MSDGQEHTMRVSAIVRHRVGGWLPTDQDALEEWLAGLRSRVEGRAEPAELHPVIGEFRELIDRDPDRPHVPHPDDRAGSPAKPYRKRHSRASTRCCS